MPRPSKTWLITDTHFFHDLMIKECGRPENYNELIMKNLRQFVAPQDVLIHLGDCIFYRYPALKDMLDSIVCSKILLMGNHDHKPKAWFMRNGFSAAMDMMVWGNVFFSHEPVERLPDGVEFNIHGHFHNTGHRTVEEWYDPAIHKLLAIENTKYKPVDLKVFLPQAQY